MMDVFQSTPALIRSVRTLAPSVSTPLIITHDCCDLVPTPRQLELRLRTISYKAMARGMEEKSSARKERGMEVVEEGGEGRKEGGGAWRKMRVKVRMRGWWFGFSFCRFYCFNVVHSSR